MINVRELYERLDGQSLGDLVKRGLLTLEEADARMPFAYRFSNPEGRPLQDDHGIKGVPACLQPWTKIPRMNNFYELPFPYYAIETNMKPRWMAWQEGYPAAPWAQFRPVQEGTPAWDLKTRFGKPIEREVLAYDPVGGPGEWGRFGTLIDGKETECYYTSTKMLLGRRLHVNFLAKPDMTYGDFGTMFPDPSLTWTKLRP